MVQPRKEQLKNVLTRHARFDFAAIPGDLETSVLATVLNPAIVSDTPGGVQEDVPATIWGGLEPFTILASDAISIKKGSDPTVTVTFAGSDTTTSKVIAKINAAVGSVIAYNLEGRLLIRDNVIGENSSLVLTDAVSGVLAKLGITAGTYIGYNAPVRGVVTTSLDSRGGSVFLKTPDGKNVVTDCPSVSSFGTLAGDSHYIADFPGGVPLHARLRYDQNTLSYVFSYYARLPVEPEVITANSSFNLLDGTNSLTLNWNTDIPEYPSTSMTVTFSSGPSLTRDQIVDTINTAFALAASGSASGAVSISGAVGQPYSFESGGESFEVSANGGSWVTVTLSNTVITAQDVADEFNAVVLPADATASAATDAYGNAIVTFLSSDTDGRTSSLEFRNTVLGSGTLEKLGVSPGKYRGYWVAEPYGADEIKIRGVGRGDGASLTVTASATTLTRLGLTAGTFYGSNSGEQPVGFPLIDQDNPSSPSPIVALVPEVLEFGEVDPAVESIVEQFNAKSAGSNLGTNTSTAAINSDSSLIGKSRGIADAGKPVVANVLGLVDVSVLRSVRDDSHRFFKKFIRGSFIPERNSVDALVTPVIETPGAEGNPGINVAQLWIDIDRPDLLSSRSLRLRFGKLGSARVPFTITELGLTGAEWLVNGQDDGGDGTAFGNATGPMKLLDANTDAAGTSTGGTRFIPMTSSTSIQGDRTLRIMEQEEGVTEPVSLFRQVNARWTATCGDGSTSFGDFNGPDAIQQALGYYAANVPITVGGLVLELKEGQFLVNSAYGTIDVPAGHELTLIGKSKILTKIVNEDTSANTITVGTSGLLVLKNLHVFDSVSYGSNAVNAGSGVEVRAQDVLFQNNVVRFENNQGAIFERCQFDNIDTFSPNVQIVMNDNLGISRHLDFNFIDCTFLSGDDNPVLRISAISGALSITRVRSILFERCSMSLGTTTNDGFENLTGNCGVLDLDADGTDCRDFSSGNGVIIDRIT